MEHAATEINGIKFTSDRGEMISEEISDDVAAGFTAIPGYTLVGAKAKPTEPPATPPPPPPVEPEPPAEQPPAPPPPPPPPPAAAEQPKAPTGKKA